MFTAIATIVAAGLLAVFGSSPTMVVVGTLLATFCGLLKSIVESNRWKERMNERMGKLQQQYDEQRHIIIDLQTRLNDAASDTEHQRQIKHAYVGIVTASCAVIEMYRIVHGRDASDGLDLANLGKLIATEDVTELLAFSASAHPLQ